MKNVFIKIILLVTTVLAFSACEKGGGGGGGNNTAAVPAVAGAPQGQIIVPNSGNNLYCTFTGNTFVCRGQNFTGAVCDSSAYTFPDLATMCQQLSGLQSSHLNMANACNFTSTVMYMQNTYCLNINNNGTTLNSGNMNQNNDPNFKAIQCEFEAYRVSQGRWLRREARTPKLTATFGFDGRTAQTYDLRSKFLGFDIGNFGRTMMQYKPAGIKGTADTITLSNEGLDKNLNLSQSGFAGQAVKLDVMNDEGTMRLAVSCVGHSTFKKNVVAKQFSQYVCRGTSSLYGSPREQIEVSFPYNSSLMNSELNLAENLTATVTGDSNGDNARITFTAAGVGSGVSIQASAYLKTTTQLKGTDGATTLNLTCGPQ